MRGLKVYLCGPGDIQHDINRVRDAVTRLNGSLSHLIGITLDVHCWMLEESGLEAQDRIFKDVSAADLVVFLFSRRLGRLTPSEFDTALKSFFETGRPAVRVWFEYVPHEFEIDPGHEYKRLLDFKASLGELPPHGLMYHTYRSDDPVAVPFNENSKLPSLETLVFQEFTPFLLKSAGLLDPVIADSKRLSIHEGITQEMIISHWEQRARRPGIAAVMSSRYLAEQLQQASDELVSFVLGKAEPYISGKSVIEFGSGIGRFTLPLSELAKELMAVEMCASMKEKAQRRMEDASKRVKYISSFVENLPDLGRMYDCAFSCLLFIHIVNEDNLRRAIHRLKASANTVIICEHMDETMQQNVSNFTRLWPRSTYEELFQDEFEEIASHKYDYLGDNLELIIFRRRPSQDELSRKAIEVLRQTQPRVEEVFPDAWKKWYHLFRIAGLVFPYEQLLGSYEPDAYEFLHNQITVYRHPDLPYELPDDLRRDEDRLDKKVREEIDRRGDYLPKHEEKARIDKIRIRQVDPITTLPEGLEIHLRPMSYFHYVIVKNRLNEAPEDFRKNLTAYLPASLRTIEDLKTTNIGGCGVFLLTVDNYVILSLREMVAEYPGVISYSASGSMSWYFPSTTDVEANPFLTIVRETYEELGVQLDVDRVRLFAIGIDPRGFFIQFSFFAHVSMTAREVLRSWQGAHAKYEQVPFAIPVKPEAISEIVTRYAMEPAAAATLVQLSCKTFGHRTFQQHLATKSTNAIG